MTMPISSVPQGGQTNVIKLYSFNWKTSTNNLLVLDAVMATSLNGFQKSLDKVMQDMSMWLLIMMAMPYCQISGSTCL